MGSYFYNSARYETHSIFGRKSPATCTAKLENTSKLNYLHEVHSLLIYFALIMDIDDNLLSETSSLNTQLDENELAWCSNDNDTDRTEPEDEIPSYQPIK